MSIPRDHAPPKDRGCDATLAVLGKVSGRHSFRDKLDKLLPIWRNEGCNEDAFKRFKDLASRISMCID